MNLNRTLFATVALFYLGGCGAPSATSQTLGLDLAPQNLWCPEGFQLDSSYHMCVSHTEALGPFSAPMIAKCKEYGGGPACDGDLWAVEFAREIRGKGDCLPGTTRDFLREACVNGSWLYGPFPTDAVEKCRTLDGGATCDTQRWPKSLWPVKGNPAIDFEIPAPDETNPSKTKSLWATYYYLPRVDSISDGFALRDMNGNSLGPVLSRRDWCNAAMEGSVYVRSENGGGVTYNYAGTSGGYSVDCSAYFSINVSRTKFRKAVGSYGDGVRDYILVPYRTVAVDPSVIPYGTVLYIPAARGQKITPPDGDAFVHDGYFFAGDTGGAIKQNHIDVFVGLSTQTPFPWVKSSSSATFKAQIIDNEALEDMLGSLHKPRQNTK